MKKDPRCPLCGAHLTAEELLDAGEELIDAQLGVIAGHCPHCQGNLELLPLANQLDVGYLNKTGTFDVVLSLPMLELVVEHPDDETLLLRSENQRWRITAGD
jgi:hypothetical protein